MREEDTPSVRFRTTAPFCNKVQQQPNDTASILLEQIQDQQIYLCLSSTLLRLAKEAGAPEDALKEVAHSLLARRGFESSNMMTLSKEPLDEQQKMRQTYEWLDRGSSLQDQKTLLSRLERMVIESREKQDHYRCLVRYKAEKSEEIAPTTNGSPNSRKDRFKRMVKQRTCRLSVESSDFYRFQVNEVLQNSYKFENECYRTIGSFSHLKTMFGHASQADIDAYSQIFNAVFDRSENLIITGGQEGLIKLWDRCSGSLIANLKGHGDYLNKIDTSRCNKYIISSAGDGIRFFDLASLKPLGGWKTSSIAQISSFLHEGKNYFLFGDNSFLYVLTEEVMLANSQKRLSPSHFYKFYYGDITARDSTSILVISLAPQKKLLLLGLENGQLLMVAIEHLLSAIDANQPGEDLVLPCFEPVKAHSQDIIEIKWSQRDDLWATGGKDGRCCLWELSNDRMQLITSLSVSTKGQRGRRKKQSYSCTYICWNCVYSHFAAGFQQNVEEEDSDRGRGEVLVYSLKQRRVTCQLSRDVSREYGGIRAMDAHPYFPNILLIGESDGHILFLDIFVGCIVNTFEERGFHLLHPQFQLIPSECHFTKDGLSFIVATEYGSVSLYGYDSKCFYAGTPVEQFLMTDFQQFTLQQDSMKAIPLTLSSNEDINSYPRGELLSIRAERHPHAIIVNPQMLLRALSNPVPVQYHIPEANIDQRFMVVIQNNFKEQQTHQQIYSKAFEEIERSRSFVLFHERERQYLIVSNLINEKIKMLKSQGIAAAQTEIVPQAEDLIVPEHPRRTRKRQRNPERQAISYVDDFDYHDSQEQDYNAEDSFLEQDVPEQLQEEFSEDEDEDGGRKKRNHNVTRRQTRRTQRQQHYDFGIEEEEQPQVMTRRRRRDILEQPHDLESEVPRKKQKLQEDSSEHKGYSRLKKQIDENKQLCEGEETGECYRCQISRATVFCSGCPYSQQFCSQCSKMRGKRQRQRYQCLICIYLKNSTHEQHQNLSEDNYRAVKQSQQYYLPQLQDRVRFFFQGYEEFLVQNVNRLNPAVYHDNQAFRLLPHSQDNSLTNTPLCQVVSIQYYFPVRSDLASQSKRNPGKGENAPIQMLVGLKTVSEQIFWVFYWPGLQFLLRQQIYSQIEQKNLISKLSINQLVSSKYQEMQIVELTPFEDKFPETIWKNIKVRKTDGKRLRCNTKEIEKQVNIWKISTEIAQPQHSSMIDPLQQQELQSHLQQLLNDDSPYSIFNDYVDFDIYPAYRQHVPVGMCLQTILKRLQNKYYTSQLSLKEDINLIKTNSLKFNGPNHDVTQDATKLCAMLLGLIPSHQDNCIEPKNPKEESTTKKEKKPKQSEEQPSFVAEDEVVTKKKQDHHCLSRRRKRQSSDLEEDSFSPEQFSIGVSTRRTKARNGQPKELRRVTRSAALH